VIAADGTTPVKQVAAVAIGVNECSREYGALVRDPRPHGSEKLSGEEKYRIRQGDHRIVYAIDDTRSAVTIIKAAHRRDVYR
jgi:mRNA interferase RelE/StbE